MCLSVTELASVQHIYPLTLHVLNAQDFLATTSFNDSIVAFLSVRETTGSCILMYVVLAGDGIQELSGSQSLAGF